MATEKAVRFLDIDVLEAAKARLRYVLGAYDHVYVSFSGGKDSTCVVHLLRLVMDEIGMKDRPIHLIFRDEEIIPDNVIEFVQSYRDKPGYVLYYFAFPMKSHIFLMGQHYPYVQWDENRRWLRPKPDYAITQVHPENKPLDQHETNGLVFLKLGVRGKIAVLNGIRADESLIRLKSCLLKKGEHNYIMKDGENRNIDFIKPIYDWGTGDLFKFFKEYNVSYAPIYDTQLYSGDALRVATPLHDAAYQTLIRLRTTYPKFYEQIIDLWPEVLTHERYWSEVDRFSVMDSYPKSWEGINQYIDDKIINPANAKRAKEVLRSIRTMKEKNRRLGRYLQGDCFGFPLRYVFRKIIGGGYMKGIQPNPAPDAADIAYEMEANAEMHGSTARSVEQPCQEATQ